MSTLEVIERTRLERLLDMNGGYVLDFSNTSLQEFVRASVGIEIYSDRYGYKGQSKAKRLRALWEREPDHVVGKVVDDLIRYWEDNNPEPDAAMATLLAQCREVADRLLGRRSPASTEEEFLGKELDAVSLNSVVTDPALLPVLEERFAEATRCLRGNAPLAAIILCGSLLEGLLLGVACANPKAFNQSSCSAKDSNGKVKQFHNWKLAELIDASCDVGYLTLDVKKFSHALRDFRNYIHPYQQMASGFAPDAHTARICLQVLKAAIACLSGERTR